MIFDIAFLIAFFVCTIPILEPSNQVIRQKAECFIVYKFDTMGEGAL
jgi:hypothetical protein